MILRVSPPKNESAAPTSIAPELRDHREDVSEREVEVRLVVLLGDQVELAGDPADGGGVAVGDDAALWRTGRARGVDEGVGVVGLDRRRPPARARRHRPRRPAHAVRRAWSLRRPSRSQSGAREPAARLGPSRSSRAGRRPRRRSPAPRRCRRPTRTPRASSSGRRAPPRPRRERSRGSRSVHSGLVLASTHTRSPGSMPRSTRPSANSSTIFASSSKLTDCHSPSWR